MAKRVSNPRIEVTADGVVACLVVTREDGNQLSLSSDRGSMIHWDGGKCIKDYGTFHRNPQDVISAIQEFLAVPGRSVHTADWQCDIDDDGLCRDCGVLHGAPCPSCGGTGFHLDSCTRGAEK